MAVYRFLLVVDVLDGSTPDKLMRSLQRHGAVVGWAHIGNNSHPVDYDKEVLNDETAGAETPRWLDAGPADGPPGRWMDG